MSSQHFYSDEHISAYIDGELDNEERSRILFDEQNDIELANRINQVRMLKEKIQLAYIDRAAGKDNLKSFNCPVYIRQYKTMVAVLAIVSIVIAIVYSSSKPNNDVQTAMRLIQNSQVVSVSSIDSLVGAHNKVILHVSQYQQENFGDTINNIESLLQQKKLDRDFSVEIVASGQGLKALDPVSSKHAEIISTLAERYDNMDVVACAKSLTQLAAEGDPITLMKSIMITPSVVEQVAKRLGDGWLYIKL